MEKQFLVPPFKKGNKKNTDSYRPISNLCSASKIFERMMLNRLTDIEVRNKTDLTGKSQHGFKRGRSKAKLQQKLMKDTM
jgi:hypothetical protein